MKLFLVLGLSLISVCSLLGRVPYTKVDEFTEWMEISELTHDLKNLDKDKYPAILQGGALLGDGALARALVVRKPNDDIVYDYALVVPEKEFIVKDRNLTKEGYIQSYHQVVALMTGAFHSAVWIKSKN